VTALQFATPVLDEPRVTRGEVAVSIRGLTRSFGGPNILDNLDLELEAGSFTALLGRSGSGKSTLLRTLAGLDSAPAGTVTVPDRRAVVFQEPRLLPWKRVWRNVSLGLRMQALVGKLWQAHDLTVLLVTHDVDEALLLADRAVVLIDGRIGADIAIPLDRPRHHGHPDFIRLRQRLLAKLGVDETGLDGGA
jgi:ABC-type nitrate/sulfonate/bicarbonate transport system ATPase subunit